MSRVVRFGALLLGAASALTFSSLAQAADPVVPDVPAPPLVSGFDWSGLYVGIGGGFGAVVHEVSSPIFPGGISFDGVGGEGVFGEVTVGYDHLLTNRLLIGAFASGRIGNIQSTASAAILGNPIFDAELTLNHGFDIGARLGYLLSPRTLGYVLGGYSWQNFALQAEFDGNPFEEEWDRGGYFLGFGMETVLGGNWTAKGEYRFTQYGTQGFFPIPRVGNLLEVDSSTHTFHLGLNYRFGAEGGTAATFEAPAYNWTGFYVGLAGGAGAVVHDINADLGGFANLGFDGVGGEGAFGEASVGYDHELGTMWVAGIMADARYSGITSELSSGGDSLNLDADYGFDVLARVGAKVNESTLVYALGGYSWQHFDINGDVGGGSDSIYDWDSHGFSVGGGIEAAVTNHVSLNVEYRFSQFQEDFSSEFGAPDGTFTVDPSFHTVRFGVKYKFN